MTGIWGVPPVPEERQKAEAIRGVTGKGRNDLTTLHGSASKSPLGTAELSVRSPKVSAAVCPHVPPQALLSEGRGVNSGDTVYVVTVACGILQSVLVAATLGQRDRRTEHSARPELSLRMRVLKKASEVQKVPTDWIYVTSFAGRFCSLCLKQSTRFENIFGLFRWIHRLMPVWQGQEGRDDCDQNKAMEATLTKLGCPGQAPRLGGWAGTL